MSNYNKINEKIKEINDKMNKKCKLYKKGYKMTKYYKIKEILKGALE